ncbi:unnamed protein product [Soboliphyme baturini]|uniref:Protein big brother n=1 Tax=Soboliphyme baturini TaxID=241478 RepID=A0A183IDG0_9BILA|nr:unnamed protein product [Soboliphyme baturini]
MTEVHTQHARPSFQAVYTGVLFGSEDERRLQFLRDCHEGHVDIAFLPYGLNFELDLTSGPNGDSTASEFRNYFDLDSDPPKVHMCSHFILNGVCVVWKGWIDRMSLKGDGCLMFDSARSVVENRRLEREKLTPSLFSLTTIVSSLTALFDTKYGNFGRS